MKYENLIITCCTNAPITVCHQSGLRVAGLRDAGCAGLCPKLHILRAARQTHLTALRLTQNKATSKLSRAPHCERERAKEIVRLPDRDSNVGLN